MAAATGAVLPRDRAAALFDIGQIERGSERRRQGRDQSVPANFLGAKAGRSAVPLRTNAISAIITMG